MTILQFALLGLGIGGSYALLSVGVVAIYRGTGVPNFAQGSIAMISAYVFFWLRDHAGLSQWVALPIAELFGLAVGCAFFLGVMRRLTAAPILIRIVATLALVLLLQGAATAIFGATSTSPRSVLPNHLVHLAGVRIPIDRFLLAGIAVVIAVTLGLLSTRTKVGMAVRALAESQKGTELTGYSPRFLGALTWGVGSLLAALAGILISPQAGLDSQALTLLVVPVLGAALVARFSSFAWAVVAGLAIGAVQSILQYYSNPGPWWSVLWQGVGRSQAFPGFVVIVLMLTSGRLIPARGERLIGRLPASPPPRHLVLGPVVLVGLGALFFSTVSNAWVFAGTTSVVFGLVGLSLVLVTGYFGQISLAQMAFAGIGGLFAERLAGGTVHLPFLLVLVLGSLAAGLSGLIIGLPALRVRGPSLAIVTLGAGLICQTVIFNDNWLLGHAGNPLIAPPTLFGWGMSRRWFAFVCLVIVVGVGSLVTALRRSRIGRRALAVRENESAAAAAGIDLKVYKLMAFTLSSCIAGLAGVLAGYQQGVFATDRFTILDSLQALVLVSIGGIGMAAGALVAAVGADGGLFSQLLSNTFLFNYQQVIAGGVLLIAIQLHPDGFASLGSTFRHWHFQRKRSARNVEASRERNPQKKELQRHELV